MSSKKRKCPFGDDQVKTKTTKIKSSNHDDTEIDSGSIQQKNPGEIIQEIIQKQLKFVFDVPQEIIQIIIEYNVWNVWYQTKNHYNTIAHDKWFEKINNHIECIYCACDYIFLQTSKNDIWCQGNNQFGQLGLNHCNFVNEFQLNEYILEAGIKVKKIWINNYQPARTFWMDQNNKLYACGYNERNELGFGDGKTQINKPELIENIQNVKQVAISGFHCIILNEKGVVFSHKMHESNRIMNFGQNGDGSNQFSNQNDKFNMIPFFNNIKIIQISVGFQHSLFVTAKGNIYSCGSNTHSQLGHGHRIDIGDTYPKKIKFFEERDIQIKNCASGSNHNLVLSEQGIAYAFGGNRRGQCGLNTNDKFIKIPTQISMKDKIETIKCGNSHSYIKSVQNTHYLFGWNHCNQCSLKNRSEQTPTQFSKPLAIDEIAIQISTGDLIEIKEILLVSHSTMIKMLQMQ